MTGLITNEEAAAYLSVKTQTLNKWRSTRCYDIPFYRQGRRIFYSPDDLAKFRESLRIEPKEA